MKLTDSQIKKEKTRVEAVLEELHQAIDLIQKTQTEAFNLFVEQSKYLKEYDLITEDCSEEELLQHFEYYEGYRNGLNYVLAELSDRKA